MAYLKDGMRTNARRMRRLPTDAERKLWLALRGGRLDGWKFRRQHPVPPYILDFACVEARTGVEVDGGQHAESEAEARRDAFLARTGWRVLRFWNPDVLTDIDGVLETIAAALGAKR